MSQSVDDVHAREAVSPAVAATDPAHETEARRRGLEHAVSLLSGAHVGTYHNIIEAASAFAEFLLGRFVAAVEPTKPATPAALPPPAQ